MIARAESNLAEGPGRHGLPFSSTVCGVVIDEKGCSLGSKLRKGFCDWINRTSFLDSVISYRSAANRSIS